MSNEENGTVEVQRPQLSGAEAKRLFEAYESKRKKLADAESAKELAIAERSDAVKAIFEAMGSGPFKWQGDELIIASRGDSFYFRGKNKKDVKEIG